MSKKLTAFLIILAALPGVMYIGVHVYKKYYLAPQVILPSPFENIEFPADATNYPAEWPEEFRFPKEFILLDSVNGSLPESETVAFSAKLKYPGTPSEAKKIIASFFANIGWSIVEDHTLDSGAVTMVLQKGEGNGIIAIDKDPKDPASTLIVATLFPKE